MPLGHHVVKWNHLVLEALAMIILLAMFQLPASAAMRLQDRSLYMNNAGAGVKTFYRVSFRYMSPDPVGSVELLFCNDPIPYHPCEVPAGLDVSDAALTEQTGETGFSIGAQSTNRIVLTRTPPQVPAGVRAVYTFDDIINPVDTSQAFSIRLRTLGSTDGTGPQIDFGTIRGQVTDSIEIETQVPPMLIFCLAEEVEYNCTGTNNIHYSDMGTLSPTETITAQSQMAVGTNASGGFAITAVGAPLSAGTNTITSLSQPTASRPGQNQFGINLVANDEPVVGNDPEGEWANAVAAAGYNQPNVYMFRSGDIVASSPNVSLMKKFTVSYIVNVSPSLRAGIYTTTVNFIASGRF